MVWNGAEDYGFQPDVLAYDENGQAELLMRAGQTVPVSRRYLKSLKEAIGL